MCKVIRSSPITKIEDIHGSFHEHVQELRTSFWMMGGCIIPELVCDVFSNRGWGLYPYSDNFSETISEFPVSSIQFNAGYVPLPKSLHLFPVTKDKGDLFHKLNTAPLYLSYSVERHGEKRSIKPHGIHPIDWISFESGMLNLGIDPKIAEALGKKISAKDKDPYILQIWAEDLPYFFPHIRPPRPLN